MSSRGRGRHEPNAPKVSQDCIMSCLSSVFIKYGVQLSRNSGDSYDSRCWELFKELLLLAPAITISTGLPVSIYGVGSFRVKLDSKGRKKLRVRYSPSVTVYAHHRPRYVLDENSVIGILRVLQDLVHIERKDASILEVL